MNVSKPQAHTSWQAMNLLFIRYSRKVWDHDFFIYGFLDYTLFIELMDMNFRISQNFSLSFATVNRTQAA